MPRYRPVWLEIAREQYTSLPADAREQIETRVEQLLENPRQQPRSAYDERTDQWTTTYGDGAGLIVYAVVHDRQRVIILRLV
jgi:mRNA-degrading endonuclease RelE of RelBE toxin-antitoxin system